MLIAVGLVLGTFPVYGCATFLCFAAAPCLRLNAAVLQAVNQLSTPLQFALLIPFARVGWRVALPPSAPFALRLGAAALQAVSGWCMVSVPLGIVLYFVLLHLLRRSAWAH